MTRTKDGRANKQCKNTASLLVQCHHFGFCVGENLLYFRQHSQLPFQTENSDFPVSIDCSINTTSWSPPLAANCLDLVSIFYSLFTGSAVKMKSRRINKPNEPLAVTKLIIKCFFFKQKTSQYSLFIYVVFSGWNQTLAL